MRAALVRSIPAAARHAPHWEPQAIGNIFDDIGDDISDAANAVAEGVSDAADWIAGAAKSAAGVIGDALHVIAPIVAMWPGIGTAISVAISCASAVALGEDIPDALLDTASAAIPGGIPRLAFDAATKITKDAIAGRSIIDSVIEACHNAAQQAGGPQAAAVFDSTVATIRGGNLPQSLIDAGRAQLKATGTVEMVAAYDAAVAVAQGETASQACLAAARDYVQAAGGDVALAAFDAGYALAAGKTLQEAGFAALKVFVAGNDSAAQAVRFMELIYEAEQNGTDIYPILVRELRSDLAPLLGNLPVDTFLEPILKAAEAGGVANFMAWVPQDLSDAWGDVAEPAIRAAQAILRSGQRDPQTMQDLKLAPYVSTVNKLLVTGGVVASAKMYFIQLNNEAATRGIPVVCVQAERALARNSPYYPDLARACKAAYRAALSQKEVVSASGAQLTAKLLMTPARVSPVPATNVNAVVLTSSNLAVPFSPSQLSDIINAPPTVSAPGASAPRNGVGSDIALAGVVLLACGTLWWWARSA